MLNALIYLIYLAISGYITLSVGKLLHSNGLLFLSNTLDGNTRLATAISKLLSIGYYLISTGNILLIMNLGPRYGVDSFPVQFFFLTLSLGLVTLMLGTMHMAIFYVITKWQPIKRNPVVKE